MLRVDWNDRFVVRLGVFDLGFFKGGRMIGIYRVTL